ncbi:dTMP kinase [Buchnera aphidicola]|uniref:Thymidylate kinase n=1 Tax=Buchnera aphidicola subsp. Melaphis rhois TaxID=118103 RepID=A0A4D6YCH2_BUCMH|nr:dTMP kinase [Buchnera aphidicola]QCI23340.1 dTMP kinase [Buchnera aphidicola (Melaphis rhois)]
MLNNKFIVIEGIEGSGKTTMCHFTKNLLFEYGITNIKSLREPGGTPLSEKIRCLIKHSVENEPIFYETELLLIYAARVQLIKSIINPELKKGTWIISDRFTLSSLAYQGGGRGIERNKILFLQSLFAKNPIPDVTFYLDVKPTIGIKRIQKRKHLDRIEKNKLDFFVKVRKIYLTYVNKDPKIIKINANHSLNTVKKNFKLQFFSWLKKDT